MLFNNYPREVGPPRKIVNNKQEFLDYVNLYNGKKKAIYTSIYMFNEIVESNPHPKPNYSSAIVDKLFFDFDDKSCNAYDEMIKLHNKCDEDNLKHCVVMSGRGYHVYIFTKQSTFEYPKEAIRGGQEYFISQLNLKIDSQVVGNPAQLARIPNTYHPKARRFCIPLTREQLEKGDDYVKELAKSQNFIKSVIMNKNLFDISGFDNKPVNDFDINIEKITSKNTYTHILTTDLPPCLSLLLNKKNPNYKERYLIILYFKEKGLMKEEVYEILKKHLSEKKLYHCIKEERQLQYLFERNDLIFPSCENLINQKICPGKCNHYGNTIYK